MPKTLTDHFAIVVAAATGLLMSIIAFFVIIDWLNTRAKSTFFRRVSEKHSLMEKLTETSQVKLNVFRSYFSEKSNVTRDEFHNVVAPLFDPEDDMLSSYFWIDRPENQVQQGNQSAERSSTTPSTTTTSATVRDAAFPVRYIHGNTYSVFEEGMNVLEKTVLRNPIKEAVSSGTIQVTNPFQIRVEDREEWVYILLYPVFDRTDNGDRKLNGLIGGMYDMSKMVELVFEGQPAFIYSQFAVLVNQTQQPSFLHIPPQDEQQQSLQNLGWKTYLLGNYRERRPLQIAHSACMVTYAPGPALLNSIDVWLAPAGAGIVVLLTAFLIVYLRIMENRNQVIERTVEEKTRQLEQANKAKSDFLARMSHEIRTPLNAVMGMTNLLEQTSLNREQEEYVNVSKQSSRILLDLINDVLDLSKMEAGELELHREPFEVESFVSDTVSYLAREAAQSGIDLHMLVDGDCPAVIREDRNRLRQVLINLISNAIKYTENGEVNVFVSQQRTEDDYELRFEVEDTGRGIPENKQETLFDEFTRAEGSSTNEVQGTGLGLSISKELVELMGGRIDVDSEEGKGSTFYFQIPVLNDGSKTDDERNSETVSDQVRVNLSGDDILIIDDTSMNRTVLRDMFSDWNGRVSEATSSADGLTHIRSERDDRCPYDLIVIDSDTVTGHEQEWLQELNEIKVDQVLLMLSLEKPGEELESLKQLDISDCLMKPVDRSSLQSALLNDLDHTPEAVSEDGEPLTDDFDKFKTPPELLIAEDNEHNRKLMGSILKRYPVTYEFAVDGEEALRKAREQTYDLIFMDVRMPEMNGLEVTEAYRDWEEQNDRTQRTPIVALTAQSLQEHRQESLDAGCDAHLMKPVMEEELLDHIRRFIDTSDRQVQPASARTDEMSAGPEPDRREEIEIDERFREFVPELMQDIRNKIKHIKEKSKKTQFEDIDDIAHDIKGTSASYGFQHIQQLAADIETHAENEEPDEITARANCILEHLDQASITYV